MAEGGKQYKIQTSFVGGELSPRMLGRTDLDHYDKSVKKMRNAHILTHGGATRRPGLQFIDVIKNSSKPVRLIPYTYSQVNAYILVINDGVIRFIEDGGYIESGGTPIELSIPYADNELGDVTYTQSGNRMFLCHPNHRPKELFRIDDYNWSISDYAPFYRAFADAWYKSNYVNFKILKAGEGYAPGDKYTFTTNGSGVVSSGPTFTGTGKGAITQISVNATTDVAQTWTVTCTFSADQRQEFTVSGSVTGQPSVQWSAGDYPRSVSFYNQRLYFAGSNTYPQTIWGSQIGDYYNLSVGPNADDGVNWEIASNTYDEIIHLNVARTLLALSVSSEFSISMNVATNVPSISANTFHGTSALTPLRVGQEVLFVQKDGRKVRAMSYDVTLDSTVAPDLTLLSEHITGDGIVDMSFQQDPDAIIWAIRADGAMVSLTHLREQSISAWAHHTTDGSFEAVATIPENNTDVTYVVVKRNIDGFDVKFIEQIDYTGYTDSFLKGSVGTATASWSGLYHLEGKDVVIRADGKYHPPVTVVSGAITLQYPANDIEVGLPFETEIELLHPEVSLPEGTAQGRRIRVSEVVLRLQDTVGLQVNGDDIPVERFTLNLDSAPQPFTGDKQVTLFGWETPNNIVIKQILPMPFTLTSVISKMEISD